MLKNIWYCIKKTSEWYFALLVLYIILTLVNATIPILSAFLPKLVIEKLTLGSDIKGLIGTIMVFMGKYCCVDQSQQVSYKISIF